MTSNRRLSFAPLKREDWSKIEAIFGPNGACGGCWCMYWRAPSTGNWWNEHKGVSNRDAFKRLVHSGNATGVLGFADSNPVAWCSVGPRTDFAYLARSRNLPPTKDETTWSITCFFIKQHWRKRGVAKDMLVAAIAYARERGGTWLEAYPTTPRNDGVRIPDAFAHTGVPVLFESAGFELAAVFGARRLYRMKL